MPIDPSSAFVSYSREDAEEFALRLCEDLKKAGASIWLDQLELEPGKPWDEEIEKALDACPRMLAVLSPVAVASRNVRDEINFALGAGKIVIPVLYLDCRIPFRLDRLERIDFRMNYDRGLNRLLKTLGVQSRPAETAAAVASVQAGPSAAIQPGKADQTAPSTEEVPQKPPRVSEDEEKKKNFQELQRVASGDASGMLDMARAYDNGWGIAKNAEQAVAWYRKAAEAGNATAMFLLGAKYEDGDGVAKDIKQAITWYHKAADAGDPSAAFSLGHFYETRGPRPDYEEARRWYSESAKHGGAGAEAALQSLAAAQAEDMRLLEERDRERKAAEEKARLEDER